MIVLVAVFAVGVAAGAIASALVYHNNEKLLTAKIDALTTRLALLGQAPPPPPSKAA